MRRIRLLAPVLVLLGVLTGVASVAQAAPITIGSPLTAPFGESACSEDCTVVSTQFNEPAAVVASPVNGVIVRWHILGGSPLFKYKLRVVSRPSSLVFTGSGTSAPVSPAGPTLQTFPTNLPIHVGQLIAIDLEKGAPIGFLEEEKGDIYAFFPSPLLDGQTAEAELFEGEVAFNAEIQPQPTISGITPSSGSVKGGTTVTITGSDFSNVSSVAFGSLPAQSFTVNSESQITAVAPRVTAPSSVPVSVTTPAGTATSSQPFTYRFQCVVPKVKGLKLKAAKRKIRKAHCKPGVVVIPVGPKSNAATRKLKVKRTKPKAGAVRPAGTKVRIILARP
jgi:hypothetical protein